MWNAFGCGCVDVDVDAEIGVQLLLAVALWIVYENSMYWKVNEMHICMYLWLVGWLTVGCKFYDAWFSLCVYSLQCSAVVCSIRCKHFRHWKSFSDFFFVWSFVAFFRFPSKSDLINWKQPKHEKEEVNQKHRESGCYTGNRKIDLLFVHLRMEFIEFVVLA